MLRKHDIQSKSSLLKFMGGKNVRIGIMFLLNYPAIFSNIRKNNQAVILLEKLLFDYIKRV